MEDYTLYDFKDIRRLVGKTYKQKWKHFKQIIKV